MAVTIDGTNGINDIVLGSSTPAAATVTTFTSNGIDDNADAVAITIDSSENVGIGSINVLDKLHVYEEVNSALATQLLLQNEGAGNHSAGIAFQVSASAETTAFAPKAGIVFERTAANGGGRLKFFNDAANDASGFSAGDERMRIHNNGVVSAT